MEHAHQGHRDPGADRQEVSGPSGGDALPDPQLRLRRRIAKRGVPAANKYAKIAPAAPHAQHMPSHIYSMVGMWEGVDQSRTWRSVAVANEYAAKAKLDGTLAGVPHAYDFMAYAHLQLGQDAKAQSAHRQEAASIKKVIGARLAGATARAAVPARYMLERQDWRGRAQLPPLGTGFPTAEAITHFARAMGAARSGDLTAAKADMREAEGAARGAGEGQPGVLGRAGRGPGHCRAGLARSGAGQQGRSVEVHARGRRSRGRQREARGHGESAVPDA